MKIAILGYGKMGKTIEQYCMEHTNHEIVLKINSDNKELLQTENLQKADVAIEFSTPENAVEQIQACFEANLPVVSGTTGWLSHFNEIVEQCKATGNTFFYASNFSIGVNIYWQVIELASKLLNQENTTIEVAETHHIHKKDAPSGTAITTAEKLLENNSFYKKWVLGKAQNETEMPIFAEREGEVPGTHLVTFNNPYEQISIEHKAKSRLGFVIGAVKAAEFIEDKTGFYTMNDLLNS